MHCYRVTQLTRAGAWPDPRADACGGPTGCTCRCDDCHEERVEALRDARAEADKLRARLARHCDDTQDPEVSRLLSDVEDDLESALSTLSELRVSAR
jgi:hypothetical protein